MSDWGNALWMLRDQWNKWFSKGCVLPSTNCGVCTCHYRGAECQWTVSVPRGAVHQSYHRVSRLRHLLWQCTEWRCSQCSAVFKDNSREKVGSEPLRTTFHSAKTSPSPLFPCKTFTVISVCVSFPDLFRFRQLSRFDCLLVVVIKLFLMASTLYWYIVFINFVPQDWVWHPFYRVRHIGWTCMFDCNSDGIKVLLATVLLVLKLFCAKLCEVDSEDPL